MVRVYLPEVLSNYIRRFRYEVVEGDYVIRAVFSLLGVKVSRGILAGA
jgi:hypothetical protein